MDMEKFGSWEEIYKESPSLYSNDVNTPKKKDKRYRAAFNRFNTLRKMKSMSPERYWELYSLAFESLPTNFTEPSNEISENDESPDNDTTNDESSSDESSSDESSINNIDDELSDDDTDENSSDAEAEARKQKDATRSKMPNISKEAIAFLMANAGKENLFKDIDEARKYVMGELPKGCI